MMCPNFLFVILGDEVFRTSFDKFKKSQKALKIKELLTSLFDSNRDCNSHTNHGVVTCADETHHFCALVSFETH